MTSGRLGMAPGLSESYVVTGRGFIIGFVNIAKTRCPAGRHLVLGHTDAMAWA